MYLHSVAKVYTVLPFYEVKMPMFWGAGMREGGKPLPVENVEIFI